MKNLSYLLNAILIVAVVILYYLHFSQSSESQNELTETSELQEVDQIKSGSLPVYYINTDTVWTNYQYVKDLDARLKSKQAQFEREFQAEAQKFEREVQEFQEAARTMTQAQGEKKQEELILKEQELSRLKEQMSTRLVEDEQLLNKQLKDSILSYVRKNRNDVPFSYVLGYSSLNSSILLANDSLDITSEILNGLNKAYAEETESK